MILLDTHVWVWWVNQSGSLSADETKLLAEHETIGLGVSVISCWEVAMLVAKRRLVLSVSVEQWVRQALRYPGVRLIPITPAIAVASTKLPDEFHDDPADRILVATSIARKAALITHDARIKNYRHVQAI